MDFEAKHDRRAFLYILWVLSGVVLRFQSSLLSMGEKYLGNAVHMQDAGEEDPVGMEEMKHRDHLERKVETLKRKLEKDVDIQKSENVRMLQENVQLLRSLSLSCCPCFLFEFLFLLSARSCFSFFFPCVLLLYVKSNQ